MSVTSRRSRSNAASLKTRGGGRKSVGQSITLEEERAPISREHGDLMHQGVQRGRPEFCFEPGSLHVLPIV